MPKKLKALFIALTVLISVQSKNSEATVGLITVNPALVTVGLVISVGGAAGYAVAEINASRGDIGSIFNSILIAMGSIAVGSVGLIVLDGEEGYAFAELDQVHAAKLGVTNEERLSFNSEIDQVNMLAAHVDRELSQIKNPTAEDSEALWSTVTDAVAPETLKAMQRVSLQLLK